MNRKEYTDAVLTALRHVTDRERLAIRAELDAHIIDADAVYHALLESSATLRAELTARFGPSILDGEGRVNRKALGGVVFGDPAALAELNAITHRFILAEIDRQAAGAEEQGRSAVAIDAIAPI